MRKYFTPNVIFNIVFTFSTLLFISVGEASDSSIPVESKKDLSFFKVSEKDDIISALEKFEVANCKCVKGKSESLDTDGIKQKINQINALMELNKILSWDKNLNEWAKDDDFKSKPIDVLNCEPINNDAFNYWNCYFSTIDEKLLQIWIGCKDYKLVRKQLISKYGKCVENNYCETNNSGLLITKTDNEYQINIFFFKNIESHYNKNKEKYLEKKQKSKELIKKAF